MIQDSSRSRGLFITLEGGEGVGKSTLAAHLKARLQDQGREAITTREPGGTPLAEAIRSLVLHPPEDRSWSSLAQALLMNAARADHLEKLIIPSLEADRDVICDRFSDSTLAYQSINGDVSLNTLRALDAARLNGSKPDLTLILDAAPQDVHSRRLGRTPSGDVFEQKDMEFHAAVRENFLLIAREETDRCVVFDALKPTEVICDEAMKIIDQRRLKLQESA